MAHILLACLVPCTCTSTQQIIVLQGVLRELGEAIENAAGAALGGEEAYRLQYCKGVKLDGSAPTACSGTKLFIENPADSAVAASAPLQPQQQQGGAGAAAAEPSPLAVWKVVPCLSLEFLGTLPFSGNDDEDMGDGKDEDEEMKEAGAAEGAVEVEVEVEDGPAAKRRKKE